MIHYTVGNPAAGLGATDDIAVNEQNGDIWFKKAGTWTLYGANAYFLQGKGIDSSMVSPTNGDVPTYDSTLFGGVGGWKAAAPTGGGGGTGEVTVSGTQNDSNKVFTLSSAITGAAIVFLNGQLLRSGSSNDYLISGTTLTLQAAREAPSATDVLQVFGYIAAPSGLVLLEQYTASNSAALNFLAAITSQFDEYQIEVVGMVGVTNVAQLIIEVSTDGGATWKNTGYSCNAFVSHSTGAVAQGNNVSTTAFMLTNALYNASGWSFSGSYKLFHPLSSTLYKAFSGIGIGPYGSPTRSQWWSSGHYESLTPVNAFRVRMSSGNIASGSVRVYGLTK